MWMARAILAVQTTAASRNRVENMYLEPLPEARAFEQLSDPSWLSGPGFHPPTPG